MNRFFLLLILFAPALPSERRRAILESNESNGAEEKITRPMFRAIAGLYACPLLFAFADVAQKEQCPHQCSTCLVSSGLGSCGCALLWGLIACNECRKEWVKHAKK